MSLSLRGSLPPSVTPVPKYTRTEDSLFSSQRRGIIQRSSGVIERLISCTSIVCFSVAQKFVWFGGTGPKRKISNKNTCQTSPVSVPGCVGDEEVPECRILWSVDLLTSSGWWDREKWGRLDVTRR